MWAADCCRRAVAASSPVGLLVELVALEADLGCPVAAHLVDGGVDELLEALTLGHVLDAVGTVAEVGRTQDLPVGGNHAVPAGVAQDTDVASVVGAAPVGAERFVFGVGDAVVGHDGCHLAGRGLELETTVKERNEVGVEVVAGEDVVLTSVVVVVAATLDGTGADVVLEHDGDGVLAPALVVGAGVIAPRGLHAATEELGDVAVGRGILADRAAEAGPHDVGADVNLRSKVHAQTACAPGATGVTTGLLPQLGVEGADKAVVVGDAVELVGIGGVHVGDAELVVLLAPLLDGIDPLDVGGVGVEVGIGAGDAGAKTLAELLGSCLIQRHCGAGEAVMPHEGDDLLARHLGSEGYGTVLIGLAPVLVEVELAVAVGIAEGEAAHLDHPLGAGNADLHAVGVGVEDLAGAGLLGLVQGLDALAVGLDGIRGRIGCGVGIGVGVGARIAAVGGRGATGVVAGDEACRGRCERRAGKEVPTGELCHVSLLLTSPCSARAFSLATTMPVREGHGETCRRRSKPCRSWKPPTRTPTRSGSRCRAYSTYPAGP